MKAALKELAADVLAVLAFGTVIVLALWFGGVAP